MSRWASASFYNVLFYELLLGLFILPVAFLPGSVDITGQKVLMLTIISLLALLSYFIGRLLDGIFVIPRSGILLTAFFLWLAYLITSIFSTNARVSFTGTIFDTQTFWIMTLLFVLTYLVAINFHTISRIAYAYLVLFAAAFGVYIMQLSHILLSWSWGGMLDIATSNPIGSWYDLGIFFGFIAVLSLVFVEFGAKLIFFQRVGLFVGVLSLSALIAVNFNLVWILMIVFAVVLAVLKIYLKRGRPIFCFVIITVSLLAILSSRFGIPLDKQLSRFIVAPADVRPSWQGTYVIGRESLKHDPVLGVGPNLFVRDWHKYKPQGMNEGLFWQNDFNFGVGYIPTTLVTMGLLGFLFWLLFLFSVVRTSLIDVRNPENTGEKYVYHLVAAVGVLYLWTFAFIYTPGITMITLTFIFTGLLIALNIESGKLKELVISTKIFPSLNKAAFLAIVLFSLGVASVGYLYVQMYRAAAFYQKGDLESLQKAAAIDDQDGYFRALTVQYMLELGQVISSDSGDNVEALREHFRQVYNKVLEAAVAARDRDKSNYSNWITLGRAYSSSVYLGIEGAYEEAKTAYQNAFKLNPTSPTVPYEQARLEWNKQDSTVALGYLNQTLELKRDFVPAYLLAAEIALSGGDEPTARKALELGVSYSPSDPDILLRLGYLYYKDGEYGEAKKVLERAIEQRPDYADARYFLGLSQYYLGNIAEALEEFSRLHKTNPDSADVTRIMNNLSAGMPPL